MTQFNLDIQYQDLLEANGAVPVAYGSCPKCHKPCEERIYEVKDRGDRASLPWVLLLKKIYKLPVLDCCGIDVYPSYIRLVPENPEANYDKDFYDNHNKYDIGIIKAPVVTDDFLNYPILRTYDEHMEISRQLDRQQKLLDRTKEAFMETCYTYFTIHYNQIIPEIDGKEIMDIMDIIYDYQFGAHLRESRPTTLYKKDMKSHVNWAKKQIRNLVQTSQENGDEAVQRFIFELIVNFFVEWEMIQGIHFLHWNVNKYQKMIGRTLLTYMVLQFPLTKYFSFMREKAIYKLVVTNSNAQIFRSSIFNVQEQLDKANANIRRLQELNSRQRDAIYGLEERAKGLELDNMALDMQVQNMDEPLSCDEIQGQKILDLKGIIDMQAQELRRLRSFQKEALDRERELEAVAAEALASVDKPDRAKLGLDLSKRAAVLDKLKGMQIGIFGDIHLATDSLNIDGIQIEYSDSAQTADGINLMNRSDILVVLTQQISHNCMWALRSHADANNKPILFSRHSNLDIILEQAAELLA